MRNVGEVMVSPVVSVGPRDTLTAILNLSRQRQIGHFPVVDKEKLVGIVTDRNLREASTHPAVYNLLLDLLAALDRGVVEEIMVRNVITVAPETPVKDAARLMRERKIGCLPVVKDGRLVGIVTTFDLLRVLSEQA